MKYLKLLLIVLFVVSFAGCDQVDSIGGEGNVAVVKGDEITGDNVAANNAGDKPVVNDSADNSDVNNGVDNKSVDSNEGQDDLTANNDSGSVSNDNASENSSDVEEADNGDDSAVADDSSNNTDHDMGIAAEEFLGSADAPITLIEFSDFECPYCSKFANGSLKLIKENYVETGKVKYAFRDLPLPFHKNAAAAAEAARCAGRQGYFYQMHDKLFETVEEWASLDDPSEKFSELASEFDVDVDTYEKCLADNETKAIVDESLRKAQELGINGTPSFVVNGYFVSGALPYETWQKIFDKLLEENK